MIWLLFKNCRKNKSAKSEKNNGTDDPNKIIGGLLSKLDVFNDPAYCGDKIFVTDTHFTCLSVVDPYNEIEVAIQKIIQSNQNGIEKDTTREADNLEDSIETTMMINNRCAKVTDKLLKSLQCPFTWDLEPSVWKQNVMHRIENKYGKHNTNMSSIKFSFEKFISNLMISCGLVETNQAHDKLTEIWGWLDKLENHNEQLLHANIKCGLKHIVMSMLCHILYTTSKVQCKQLFEMITPFNSMDTKSRAAIYAIRAAICVEIGGKSSKNAVHYAQKACELDSDTAYWKYFHSVALTAQRQYISSCKSCPTESEFDAIQYAIILVNEPNPYFNFHRMILMKNKLLYHYHIDDGNSDGSVKSVSSKQIVQDFGHIVELIKAIVSMEPEDPHLIVRCAMSLITLPYFDQDNDHLIKQILSVAIKIAFNDPTIIEAVKKSIEVYRQLANVYKKGLIESIAHSERTNVKNSVEDCCNKDDNLENDLKLVVNKQKTSNSRIRDLINLLVKYDGNDRWKIMAQICSYSILFKDSASLLVSVEQFMMLINDKNIAVSDMVTNHRSIFIENKSKVFNLAELVSNEIKLAITYGNVKNQDEMQFYLDQLTKITEVCQLKSKKANPNFVLELLELDKEEFQNRYQKVVTVNQKSNLKQSGKPTTKQILSKNAKQKNCSKPILKNNKRVHVSIPKKKINREKFNCNFKSELLESDKEECQNSTRKVVTVIQKIDLQKPTNQQPSKIVLKMPKNKSANQNKFQSIKACTRIEIKKEINRDQ